MSLKHLQPSYTLQNRLLGLLPPSELASFRLRMEPVPLALKDVLLRPEAAVAGLYFIEEGTVSMIATLEDGSRIEVGMVGREGFVGLPLLLGGGTSAVEAMVQSEGMALRLPARELRAALAEAPALFRLLLRYVDAFTMQVSQSAACNGRHHIAQRLARWLLMTHDRVGSDRFVMTQEFMSTMLGVRRPSVTRTIGALQAMSLIRHGQGVVTIRDRAGLEAVACDCYATVRRRFEWLEPARATVQRPLQPPIIAPDLNFDAVR